MIKLRFKALGMLALITTLLASCSKQGPEYVSDYDVVITNYDPEKKELFSEKKSFGMPWKVVHVGDTTITEPTEFDIKILETTKSEMEAKGYTYIPETSSDHPDIVVLCYSVTTTSVYMWWDWWGGYPGWGYPGFGPGWGYPGYMYPVRGIYAYQKGTVMIEIAENIPVHLPAGEDNEVKYPIMWEGVTNGYTTNTQNEIMRVEKNIKQMFVQSPYIQTGASN
ncbi:DUF4136 domain-containing protein [Flammeovirga pacifica]|uniref:DUF4136 domain-containing protein n=1 Tax=Flammeovirga pacifica TaxID=915059 RepID=A0A1S1YXF1_FLAPC|nr:DUF4136 domain-containing protein [Flammeovirga pacifica]OHX65603.1 hypothetical protein NH26_04190 [Flammeovirga pacifica]